MYIQTLAPNTKIVLTKIANQPFLSSFYLSGGTALALHLGHRESEDLDFFTQRDFDPIILQIQLEKKVNLSGIEQDLGTLNCYADDVKLQFLHYPYNLISSPTYWNNIQLSSIEDIACTKLLTISSRGSKKDFIDLHFILNKFTLNKLFALLKSKYHHIDYNEIHILKSLVYFADADIQVMPRMHSTITWDEVKNNIKETVKRYKIT